MEKNKIKRYARMSIISVLGYATLILMVGEPIEDETWFCVFFISKGLAFLIGYCTYKLYSFWELKGLLPEMDEDI